MNISPEDVFSALSNETRFRCVLLLLGEDELCVCECTYVVGAAQPNISRHLGQLRDAGLVTGRRDGQWIYYRINPRLPDWVVRILEAAVAGAMDNELYRTDPGVLETMPSRRRSARCG